MEITLSTYKELGEYITAFSQGAFEILMIHSAPGLGKSTLTQEIFSPLPHCYLEGRITPLELYCTLYQYQDYPIICDDTDGLLKDLPSLNLLKTLCQTGVEKRVSWHTTKKLQKNIPSTFDTSSTLLLLTNEHRTLSTHFSALADRGISAHFTPTYTEIHNHCAAWVNPIIHQFIGDYLHLIPTLSLRDYIISASHIQAGLNWQISLINSWHLPPAVDATLKILLQYPHNTQEENQYIFSQETQLHPKAYTRALKQLFP
jgi:hypothetical protein